MARTLKVVFRSDVRGIASAGDVKVVSPGYARNYLFPRELAFPATDEALRQWETERQGTLAKVARQRETSEALGQRIEAATCTIKAKVGQEGRLFGSVGRQEIAEALSKDGIRIDKRDIEIPEPIRQVGESVVTVRLPGGHQAQLKVSVVAEA